MICDSCGRANAAAARFCDACGASSEAGRPGARKIVTVVFTDVVGSTALGERLDAETLHRSRRRARAALTAWRVFGVWPDAWPLSDHRQGGAAGRVRGPTGTP
jgi:hypothetical protein